MSSLLGNATAPPRLPGIRRMVVVGAVALTMVVLAIAASLFELRHDRDMRHQYENSLMVTHVAFDAESLASRMHTWEDLNEPAAAPVPAAASAVPGAAAPAAPPNLALREALRSVDIDLAEWQRRVTDARQRELSADTQTQLARLQDSVAAMRQALHTPSEILEAAQTGAAAGGDKPAELREGVDKAYLSAIEAAQVALLASVRSGGEKLAIGRYTESEISAAVVVGASLAALTRPAAATLAASAVDIKQSAMDSAATACRNNAAACLAAASQAVRIVGPSAQAAQKFMNFGGEPRHDTLRDADRLPAWRLRPSKDGA